MSRRAILRVPLATMEKLFVEKKNVSHLWCTNGIPEDGRIIFAEFESEYQRVAFVIESPSLDDMRPGECLPNIGLWFGFCDDEEAT